MEERSSRKYRNSEIAAAIGLLADQFPKCFFAYERRRRWLALLFTACATAGASLTNRRELKWTTVFSTC